MFDYQDKLHYLQIYYSKIVRIKLLKQQRLLELILCFAFISINKRDELETSYELDLSHPHFQ